MEVLDADRPPSAFARWAAPLLQRRGVKGAAAVAVAALVAGGWLVASSDADTEEQPLRASDPAGESAAAPSPPAERAQPQAAGPWRISDDIRIRFADEGRLITFFAVNGGGTPQDPRDLQVEASYPGGSASSYAFGCVGGHRTPQGFRALGRPAAPMEKVFVRCPDTVRLNGQPGRLPPEVITVVNRP